MGDVIGSFFSGFVQAIGKLFGSPLDFLSGKSCSSVCQSTRDFICYIEHFCIANLVKLAMVSALLYIVLVFFYMSFKLGICQCICQTLCGIRWACFAACLYRLGSFCSFLCYYMPKLKQKRRRYKSDIEGLQLSTRSSEVKEGGYSFHASRCHKDRASESRRWKNYKQDQLRRYLRPRNHRTRLGTNGLPVLENKKDHHIRPGNSDSITHDLRMSRSSKFATKGGHYKGSVQWIRRR